MGLFDRIRKRETTTASAATKTKEKKAKDETAAASTSASEEVIAPVVPGGRSSYLLVTPRISEKAAGMASKGTYVFNVPVSANKVEVRKAVESLYKVSVTSVRTSRSQGKRVSRGRIAGQRKQWKKALVTLKTGQKIDIHEGV